jgi:peptide/nickel transport system substrate-binding protein
MTYRKLPRLALLGVIGALAVLVTSGAQAAQTQAKPVLTIGISTPFTHLDPAKGGGTGPPPLAFEPIMYPRPDGSFTPGLATSWRYVPAPRGSGLKNKVFEFTLRRNARFSDGAPVTAQAVKTWFEYYLKTSAVAVGFLAPVKSFEVVDRWKVRVTLRSPFPDIPAVAFSWRGGWAGVSSPRALGNPDSLASATFGAGPYMLNPAQTVTNSQYTLVPNPYYYDKSKIKWSRIVYRVITTPTSMLEALRTGQIDIAAGAFDTARAAEAAGFKVFGIPATSAMFTLDAAGARVKALGDVRVRQALNYAVNRRQITTAFVGKYGQPTSAIATANGSWRELANHYPYNPTRARALLRAAGYGDGFTVDGVLTAGFAGSVGTPLAQAVAQQLAAVGVRLNLKTTSTLADYLAQGPANPDQPAIMQWPAGLAPMATIVGLSMRPAARVNHVGGNGWNDPKLNAMAVAALRASNATAANKAITEYVTRQAYFLPVLVNHALVYVNTKRVAGFKDMGFAFRYANDLGQELDWSPAK